MPGLVRGVARTAVIAGTATSVSGRVARRQAEKYAARDAGIHAQREAAYQQQVAAAAAPAPAAPAPVGAAPDPIGQLERLGALLQQGLLTPEEFAAQKARLLGS
jgi:hypothetical protein